MQAEGVKGIRFSNGKQALRELDNDELNNDYDGVQVRPTPDNEVDMFHYGSERLEWKERYIA